MDRTVLHCDCNGFYASVACIKRPFLNKVPMAVCGDPDSRHGIILAKNEIAKQYGVITAETVWQARKKCPDLVLVSPDREEYQYYSKMVNQVYLEYTDMVEPFGIDESWMDVTGSRMLFGDGVTIANELRQRIQKEIGLTISVGVSFNKIFAKLGSDYKKPNATTLISRDNYKQIVWPLPVSNLLYIGKSANSVLRNMRIRTIGELAQADKSKLNRHLGKLGESIWEYANGLEDSPVRRYSELQEIKSVGNGMTFRRNLDGLDDIKIGVYSLCDTVAARLRKYGLKCSGIQVQIKDPQFHVTSRQTVLPYSTCLARELSEAALRLIVDEWDLSVPIRMLTITGIYLKDDNSEEQTDFFYQETHKKEKKQTRLETAMDSIRGKYGKGAIQLGVVLKNDVGIRLSQEEMDTAPQNKEKS